MTADLTISQGDTTPALVQYITDQLGNPLNLTGASVNFVMRSLASAAPAINAAASITNATSGKVTYSWATGDTTAAGMYMGQFLVTFSGGATYTWPNGGYLEIEVTESLTGASQQLISVAMAKDLLNIPSTDRSHDTKILRFINAMRPLIERITGPVVVTNFEEWHDGGGTFIVLRRRPSTALGTSPVLTLIACSEYNGPIEWPLAIIQSPDFGQTYSCQLQAEFGRVVRRTAGGGVQPFPYQPQAVHVAYAAGQQTVPDNVTEAMGLLVQMYYQPTQQGGPSTWGRMGEENDSGGGTPIGFQLPGRVRELLAPNRRAPAIA